MKHFIKIFIIAIIGSIQFANAQFTQQTKQKQVTAGEAKPIQNNVINKPLLLNPVYDFSDVKICVDPIVQAGPLPPRRTTAGSPIPRINADGSLSQVAVIQQGLVAATEKMWNPGDVINVWISPINGSTRIWNMIKFYAKEWEKYANIKFQFVDQSYQAQIRVGCFKTGQSWSKIGRDALNAAEILQ